MRTLVTGGAGFIGSHIADALLDAGHQVLILDDLSTGRVENVPKKAEFSKVDVTSPEAERIIAEWTPGAIFHLAAQMDVRRSVTDPIFDANVNVLGTVRVTKAAVAAGTQVIVFSSSGGAIYGEQQRFPADENHPTRPVSPYGNSKLCAEHYLSLCTRMHNVRTVALRYANVYGPRQDAMGEAGVVAIFSQRILQNEPIVIYGDGRQTRDFVFVADVVRANLRALDNEVARGSYNIGTGLETDINAIAQQLMVAAGQSVPMSHEGSRFGEQRRSVIDPDLAKRELNWSPEINLREGLERTLNWFKQQPATAGAACGGASGSAAGGKKEGGERTAKKGKG